MISLTLASISIWILSEEFSFIHVTFIKRKNTSSVEVFQLVYVIKIDLVVVIKLTYISIIC